jgi:hypothetical protein
VKVAVELITLLLLSETWNTQIRPPSLFFSLFSCEFPVWLIPAVNKNA